MTGEPGLYNGLTVTINNQLEDYFYSKQESLGANVHVFLPTDYPDKNSGSLSEYLVGVSTEFLLEIGILSTHTVKDVINYPIEKRQCYFQSERHTRFGVYSESDCLVSCRIRSMLGLCGCVPFMIPMQNQKLICGFSDIECLHKYRCNSQLEIVCAHEKFHFSEMGVTITTKCFVYRR
ncbi:ASC domain containing protein [Asbolus verrucosus]|uniref:ASC domain containing protein n=1 Tax=Asbolus verrucosus TaxID=1661398 RepID=A0A482VBC8_ASBVE|nr:ASC domain containing protein [Asbolus verrucosus]